MKPAKTKTIFSTLLSVHLAAISLLVFIIGGFTSYHDYRHSIDDLKNYGRLAVDTLRLASVDPILNTLAYDRIYQLTKDIAHDSPDVNDVIIYNAVGTPVAYSGNGKSPSSLSKATMNLYYTIPLGAIHEQLSKDNNLAYITPLSLHKDVVGFVYVGFVMKRINNKLIRNIIFFMGIALLAIAISSFIYYELINARIIHPLHHITYGMKEFGNNKNPAFLHGLRQQFSDQPNNEIALMHTSFVNMVGDILKSNAIILERESHIRLLLNSTAEAIYGLDEEGCCTFCNTAFLKMMRFQNEEELLGKNIHTLIHHSRADGSPLPEEECMAHHGYLHGQQCHSDNEIFWRADGSSFSVEIWSHPIMDNGVISGAVVTFLDITKRRKAMDALASEKERLAVTLRSIGDAVITTDINGRVTLMNKAAEELSGYSQTEATGKDIKEIIAFLDEKTQKETQGPVKIALDSGKVISPADHYIIQTKNGRKRKVNYSAAPIRDYENNLNGVILVCRDMTEQIRMQKDLLKARKLESVGILAGGIAHDFNNLLTAILGNINLARSYSDRNDKIHTLL